MKKIKATQLALLIIGFLSLTYTFANVNEGITMIGGTILFSTMIGYFILDLILAAKLETELKKKISIGDFIYRNSFNGERVQFKELAKEFEIKNINKTHVLIEDKESKTAEQIPILSLNHKFYNKDFKPIVES
jgi:hypothetical protein